MNTAFNQMRVALGNHATALRNLEQWQHIQKHDSDWRGPVIVQQKLAEARANVAAAEQKILAAAQRIVSEAEGRQGNGTLAIRVSTAVCSL